ncbi:MAG TPA: thioredoxin domain-containing protein, partial [Myxococcota bacterium]|nr:thioredoxin domain-containing protein [Myxococcota bacterium]
FLFLNGVLFVGVSLWLVYVMHFEIGAWCIVCLAIDVINLSLFGLSLAAIRVSRVSVAGAIRADVRSLLARPLLAAGLAVLGAGLLAGAWFGGQRLQDSIAQARAARQGPRKAGEDPRPAQMLYVSREDERLEADAWSRRTQDTPRDQACLDKGAGAGPDAPVRIAFGTSAEGYPWKGAEQPSVEIHEFTDFQCPYCRSAHLLVNRLVSRYPGQLRVYHRHLPLDNRCNRKLDRPFHPRACELSLIAVCAGQQGRFWEMTDYLFHNSQAIRAQGPSAEDIARALALDLGKFNCCMGDPQSMRPVEADLAAAASLNLRGTPAFVIQGQVYYGKIPDEALRVLDPPSP